MRDPEAPELVILCDALTTTPRLGFEIHLASLARAFSEFVPVTVLAWGEAHGAEDERFRPLRLLPLGPRRAGGKWPYRGAAAEWLHRRAPRSSVVWIRGFSTALLLAPELSRLRRARPDLVTVYDAASFLRLECGSGMRAVVDRLKAFLEERLWMGFDRIRTLGETMRRYLVARGVPQERILVIPVGCEVSGSPARPTSPAKRALFLGSARSWQGLPLLLDAMGRLEHRDPEIHLTVAGVLPVARSTGANVTFLGRIPHSRALELYRAHDLLVVPRLPTPLTETVVPMKIAEALGAGMPILASDLAPIREITGEDGALLVAAPSPERLAAALHEALGDPEGLRALAERAWRRAAAFDWRSIASRAQEALFSRSGTSKRD